VTDAQARFRPAAMTDAEAVTALVNERELLDRGVTEATVAAVRAQWASPDVELAADGLVGEIGRRIVGTALATRDREYVYVATDHEGRGVGSRLLEWVMARSAARGAVQQLQIVGSGNASAAALLRRAGYERTRGFHRMGLALDRAPATDVTAALGDVQIRRIDVDRDARELHRLDATAFAANADYRPDTFEQFRDEHLRATDVDRRAMLVAVEGDRIAGFLIGMRRREGRLGYVSVLGVDPASRRRGIARLLLRAAFDVWRADGIAQAQLTVASDNPGARRLYERLGMEIAYALDCFQRPPARG
jgi:mycothiol synthase